MFLFRQAQPQGLIVGAPGVLYIGPHLRVFVPVRLGAYSVFEGCRVRLELTVQFPLGISDDLPIGIDILRHVLAVMELPVGKVLSARKTTHGVSRVLFELYR